MSSLSTSKALAVAMAIVAIICQVSPSLASALTDAGLPTWAHYVMSIAGVLAIVKGLYSPSVSERIQVAAVAELPDAVAKVTRAVAASTPPPPLAG